MNNWQDPAIDAYEPATAGMTEMRDIDILDPLDQGQAEQPLLARPFDKHQRAHKLNRLFLLAATMLLLVYLFRHQGQHRRLRQSACVQYHHRLAVVRQGDRTSAG